MFFTHLGVHISGTHCVWTSWYRILGVSGKSASWNNGHLDCFRMSETWPFIRQGPYAQAEPFASGSWLVLLSFG